MLTEKQRQERQSYLGASDAASALGLSRWGTPLQLWAEKTGQLPPKDLSDKLPVILGNRLEDVVAEMFTEKTGLKVRRVNETFTHLKHGFLRCNIDRRIVGEETLLECKTASAFKAKEWAGEDIPQEYLIQVQQMLSVTGYKKAYLAVLIGNQDFIVKEVLRDNAVISEMTKKLVHFWTTYVEPKIMPLYISSEDADTLYGLYPLDNAQSIELGDDVDQLIESRQAMLQDLKSLEKQLSWFDNEIKAYLKDNESAKTRCYSVSWKTQKQKRLDQKGLEANHLDVYQKHLKEVSMRVLRVKKLND